MTGLSVVSVIIKRRLEGGGGGTKVFSNFVKTLVNVKINVLDYCGYFQMKRKYQFRKNAIFKKLDFSEIPI